MPPLTSACRIFPGEWVGTVDTLTPCVAANNEAPCVAQVQTDFAFGEMFPHVVVDAACIHCGRTLDPHERRAIIASEQSYARQYLGATPRIN